MFSPNLIMGGAITFMVALCGGFYAGADWAHTRYEARHAEELENLNTELHAQIAISNKLSEKLIVAENNIHIKTVEVIKYVPKVTTGKPCLNAATVSLLQPGSGQTINIPTSQPDAEDAAPAASDTDIAYWIATANEQYETCAERLNSLIEWELKDSPGGE